MENAIFKVEFYYQIQQFKFFYSKFFFFYLELLKFFLRKRSLCGSIAAASDSLALEMCIQKAANLTCQSPDFNFVKFFFFYFNNFFFTEKWCI